MCRTWRRTQKKYYTKISDYFYCPTLTGVVSEIFEGGGGKEVPESYISKKKYFGLKSNLIKTTYLNLTL